MKPLLPIVMALVVIGRAYGNYPAAGYPSDREIAAAHQKTLAADVKEAESGVVSASLFCSGTKLISAALQADQRVPTESDISGAWVQNPRFAGPAEEFALTQIGQKIVGLGYWHGCTNATTSEIKGTRDGSALKLQFTYCDGSTQTVRFVIVDHHGVIALARDWREYPNEYLDSAARLKRWEAEKSSPALVPRTKRAELADILNKIQKPTR